MTDQQIAERIHRHAKTLGMLIESTLDHGLTVSANIGFNEGSESMWLHHLNGELDMTVAKYTQL